MLFDFKKLIVMSFVAWSATTAHAGWFFSGDVCKDALASKGMAARFAAIEDALSDWGADAVAAVRARILGDDSAPTRSDKAVGDAAWMEAGLSVYLNAFESLQGLGPVIALYHDSNDTGGLLFSRDGKNPNVRLAVPVDFRAKAAAEFLVLKDTFSGDQIYVFPSLFTDEQGNAVPVYITPYEGSVHSDIKKVEIIGAAAKAALDGSGRKDVLNTVLDTRFWGVVENLRPGGLHQWGKKTRGATYQIVAVGSGMQGVPVNMFLNLVRTVIKNDVRGSDYPLNALNWFEEIPFTDSHGRPLNLSMALRNQDLETDDNMNIGSEENQRDPSKFALKAQNEAASVAELVKFIISESLLAERVEYINSIWNEVQETGRQSRVQQARELLKKALAAAAPDFENFYDNLTLLDQKAAYADQLLNWATTEIDNRMADPASAAQRSVLLGRRGALDALKPQVTAARASLETWREIASSLLSSSAKLLESGGYFDQIEKSDARTDVKALRSSPAYVEFQGMITTAKAKVEAYEATVR